MKGPEFQALRTIARWGGGLAVVLALSMAAVLWSDWNKRLDTGQRQSVAVAEGVQRLVAAKLALYERGLFVLAMGAREHLADPPSQMPESLRRARQGLMARNPELLSISVVDDKGVPLWDGEGDAEFSTWALSSPGQRVSQLRIGELDLRPGPQRTLRVAVQAAPGYWVLARLDNRVLQTVAEGWDAGDHGVVTIVTRSGQVLANTVQPEVIVGKRGDMAWRTLPPSPAVYARGVRVSPYDQVLGISAVAAMEAYPLVIFAGVSHAEVMASWWHYLWTGIFFYLSFLIGLAFFLRNVRAATLHQARLAEELRDGHAELALAHQVGRVGTWWLDATRAELHCSEQTQQLLDLPAKAAPVEQFLAAVHAEDVEVLRQVIETGWKGPAPVGAMFRLVSENGPVRWFAVQGARVEAPGQSPRLVGAVIDVSERIQIQAKAADAESKLQLIFERSPTPYWVFDMRSLRFLLVNQAALDQYGYTREEFLAMTILDIRPESEHAMVVEAVKALTAGGRHDALPLLHLRKDGSSMLVRSQVAVMEYDGTPACLVLAEDVSQRVAYERELAHRATHHQGTGLLNVRALEDRLDAGDEAYTIAYIQLSGLQMVSNALGRSASEQLLQAVVMRLQAIVGPYGVLAFQPGEDFVLAIDPGHDPVQVAQEVINGLSAPLEGPDSYHQLQVRVGLAGCPKDGELADKVIGRAAQAAQCARERSELLAHFDCGMADRFAERLQLANRIQHAIAADEFRLYFQPIHHAADGSVAALEALLRWPQADGGFIPPSEFIPLCEDTGQIVALGQWVIRAAAKAHQQLSAAGFQNLSIAVNVSAVQFFSGDLVETFVQVTEEFGLCRGALQVELTESSLMRDPQHALQTMQQLHRNGISVSLDDFGTGFSSLAYLQHLPLESLKIDRSFVNDLEVNPRSGAICRALLSLAHSMGLIVIAEGVETPGQLAWLEAHGCDQVQGYLLGRPMPLHLLLETLQAQTAS